MRFENETQKKIDAIYMQRLTKLQNIKRIVLMSIVSISVLAIVIINF